MAAPDLETAQTSAKDLHTISLYVSDKPGVLVRVALVFSRRGYNIESLVVSSSATEGYSRMTITCSGDPTILEQIIKQLAKLVDVVQATDHTGDDNYEAEIALLKIDCALSQRTQILQIAEHYGGKVVDYAQDSLMLRFYGSSEKLDACVALLQPFGISELVRSGKVLMARGARAT